MSLPIAVLQHERETGLGAFAPLLDDADIEYEVIETLRGRLPDARPFEGAVALGGSLNAYDPLFFETRRWIRTVYWAGCPGHCQASQPTRRQDARL